MRRELCHQSLQPKVLFQKLLHLPYLIYLETAVVRLSPLEGLIADPDPPDQLHHWHSHFRLLQYSDILLDSEALPLH